MPQENETPRPTDMSPTQLFNQALAFQQQQNWDSALEVYQNLLKQKGENLSVFQAAATYHNMSTIAYEKGDFLKAYIWSKKSLFLQPGNPAAQESFAQYSKKFDPPTINHHLTNFESFKTLVSNVSVDFWLTLSVVLTLLTLWLFVKGMVLNKKNQLANVFTRARKWPLYILLLITTLVISTTYVRYLDFSTSKAIVIAEKAPVQTAPGENKSVIYEAQAGLELEVLGYDQGFYQVRYPGAFSGWVNASLLEIMSLNFNQIK